MLREHLVAQNRGADEQFRWRGAEVSRVEGFTDAVFAFAVTLLVVSLEVPQTFSELLAAMRNFGAFALCFVLLMLLWYNHYVFFRRYGLRDRFTVLLNAVLLFVVLFYVYPLKFLFTLLVNQLTGSDLQVHLPNGTTEPTIQDSQSPALMIVYGLGYVAVFLVFALLYSHAYRQRVALALSDLERLATQESIGVNLLQAAIGGLSILIAALGGEHFVTWAGFAYFLIVPVRTLVGIRMGTHRRKYAQRVRTGTEPPDHPPLP